MDQPSDSRIRFGGSPLEDGQTFTTTFHDPSMFASPLLPPPPPPPIETVNVEEFRGLREEVRGLKSLLSAFLSQQQTATSAQTKQPDSVPNPPDQVPDRPVRAPSPSIPPVQRPSREGTPPGVGRKRPSPDLDRWLDNMLHGDIRKDVPLRRQPSMDTLVDGREEEPRKGLPKQHLPSPPAVQSLPRYHDLPATSAAFKPQLASSRGPTEFRDVVEPRASAFTQPIRPQPVSLQTIPSSREGSRRTVIPDKYHGTSPLQEYLVHFELCADLNGWTVEEKAKFLGVSLRGAAQSLLIPGRSGYSYREIVAALQERFGLEGQTEIFMAELQSLTKGSKESYQELADKITRLVARAYPTASYDTMRVLSVQAFIKALTNKELRMRIKLMKPSSIREAVIAAIEYEAIERAEQTGAPPRHEKLRKINEKPSGERKPKAQAPAPQPMVQQVGPSASGGLSPEIRDFILQEFGNIRRSSGDAKPKRRVPLDQVTCYRCSKKGHYASSCRADNTVVDKNEQERAQRRRSRAPSPEATGNA